VDGVDYNFVDADTLIQGIGRKLFIEAGNHRGHIYGTSVESVREPCSEGKVVVLETRPESIRLIQAFGDIHPIVISVQPASPEALDALGPDHRTAESIHAEYDHVMAEAHEFESIITHTIVSTEGFAETCKTLGAVLFIALKSNYWVYTNQELPKRPSNASSLTKRASLSEDQEALKLPRDPTPIATQSYHVTFRRLNGRFGFLIHGGQENDLLASAKLQAPSTINQTSGIELEEGDEIISINGVNVVGASHQDVLELIIASPDDLHMEIIRRPGAPSLKLTDLLKPARSGLSKDLIKQLRIAIGISLGI
jgi:guanylate kinase